MLFHSESRAGAEDRVMASGGQGRKQAEMVPNFYGFGQ